LPSRSGSSWFSLFYFHKVQSWRLLKELRPEPPVESPYVYGRSTAQVKGAFPSGGARCFWLPRFAGHDCQLCHCASPKVLLTR
jgi:hypothetical protein